MKEIIEEVLRNRILYIGDNAPRAAVEDRGCVQVYSGCPDDLVNEMADAYANRPVSAPDAAEVPVPPATEGQ